MSPSEPRVSFVPSDRYDTATNLHRSHCNDARVGFGYGPSTARRLVGCNFYGHSSLAGFFDPYALGPVVGVVVAMGVRRPFLVAQEAVYCRSPTAMEAYASPHDGRHCRHGADDRAKRSGARLDMGVASYLEFVTTLFAWIVYKNIWAVLVDTGIVFIPIITMVIANILSSHQAGDDEGSAAIQSLKKIEADFFTMLGVIVFAAIPVIDVQLGDMQYVKPSLDCRASPTTIPGTDTATSYDRPLATISGETGVIPIWWAALHALSKSVTAASVASIPCAPELASVEYRLAEDTMDDLGLRGELAEFTDDCYRRSKSRLMRMDTAALTPAQRESVNWLGSDYFVTTPGFYSRYYAQDPRALFPHDPVRDAGFDSDAIAGGHPSCREWWSDASKGVRRKVLDSLNPLLLNDMVYRTDNLIDASTDSTLSVTERENVLLRKYLAVTRASESLAINLPMSTGYQTAAIDHQLNTIDNGSGLEKFKNTVVLGTKFLQDVGRTTVVGLGMAVKAPEAIGEGYMIRQGISMFQALVLMIIVVVLPFLLIFSQYQLSTLMTLSIIYFGVHFMSFLWAIAYWMDNSLMALMTESGRYGVFEPLANPVQSGIILWMGRFMYLIFPMIFLTALTWAGIRAGGIGGQLGSFGANVAKPGAAGGAVVRTAATKGSA